MSYTESGFKILARIPKHLLVSEVSPSLPVKFHIPNVFQYNSIYYNFTIDWHIPFNCHSLDFGGDVSISYCFVMLCGAYKYPLLSLNSFLSLREVPAHLQSVMYQVIVTNMSNCLYHAVVNTYVEY